MFYSQLLSKPVVDNFCVKCETKFTRWTDYHKHVTEVNCLKVIKPIRTTDRTKDKIISDVENSWKKGVLIK